MRFMSILLAATGLLAVAGATGNVQGRRNDALLQREVKITASEHVASRRIAPELEDPSYRRRTCTAKCYNPCDACVKKCGGTNECKSKCECELFRDPKSLCRKKYCVEAPKDCIAVESEQSVAARAPTSCYLNCHLPWEKCVRECGGGDECGHKCNCILFSDPKQLCRVRKCVEPPQDCIHVKAKQDQSLAARDDVSAGLLPFPTTTNQCITCGTGYTNCFKGCNADKACVADCGCRWGNQFFCLGCGIPVSSCSPDHATDQARDDGGSEEAGFRIVGPGPIQNVCTECDWAFNACKAKCSMPGACDDACGCKMKHSKKCHGRPYECKCGAGCPRLPAVQRRFDARTPAEDVQDLNAVAQNINPCDVCQAGLKQCQKSCKGKPDCLNYCSCMMKELSPTCLECKLSCTPTTEIETAKAGLAVLSSAAATTNNDDPNVCDSCQAGVRLCQAQCDFDAACENACACAFKANAPQCRKCDISCSSATSLQSASWPVHDLECEQICMPLARPPYCIPINRCPYLDPPHPKRQLDTDIEVPNRCVVCRTGIKTCQNMCNGDTYCREKCSCEFKKTLQCKECDIPCVLYHPDSSLQSASGSKFPCNGQCIPIPVPPYCMPFASCPPPGEDGTDKEKRQLDAAKEGKASSQCKTCYTGLKACEKACKDDTDCKHRCFVAWRHEPKCRDCVWKDE